MKKISVFLIAAVLALSICACGSTPANNGGEQTKEPAPPPDLTGEWKAGQQQLRGCLAGGHDLRQRDYHQLGFR